MSDTITVTGNITQPELRQTSGGVPVVSFRIASTQRRYDRAEEKWVDGDTNWYSVSAFRRLGEHAFRSLRKGDRVVVTGRLRLRDWETTAKKGLTAEIDADAIGHDLLWGTTTFHRDGLSGPAVDQTAQTTEWHPDPTQGWATPGLTADVSEALDSGVPDSQADQGRPLALTGASETPF